MPSVYITGPEGIVATSTSRIIQPGDVVMIDWGVQLMNFGTDVKRVAYVLKPGEVAPPASVQNAFDKALAVRDVLKRAIKPGVRADDTMKAMDAALQAAGYGVIEFNRPNADGRTDVAYGFPPATHRPSWSGRRQCRRDGCPAICSQREKSLATMRSARSHGTSTAQRKRNQRNRSIP